MLPLIRFLILKDPQPAQRWLFSLLYLCGLRISEVVGNTMGGFFSRRDKEGEERWWLEVLGKGDKLRIVPATNELMVELARYRRELGMAPLPQMVHQSGCLPGHHGSLRLGPPLGAPFQRDGHRVKLLSAPYIRAYVKRNKTDAADACALLEAARCADIAPVKVKSIEEQALQGLHRTRSLWMGTCTARINALRGFCREFGISVATGSRNGIEQMSQVRADPHSAVPAIIRSTMVLLVEEIRLLEIRIAQLKKELTTLAKQSAACTTLLSILGIGLLTAMVAATSGNVQHFKDARHFASLFGLTPRSIRRAAAGVRGAYPNAATGTCACF